MSNRLRLVPLAALATLFLITPAQLKADIFFPQIAAGGGYVTVVTLIHSDARSGAAPAAGTLRFFNPDGTPRTVNTVEMGSGSQFNVNIPAGGIRIVTVTSTDTTTAVGAARFDISGVSVGGVATFSSGPAVVGVLTATPTMVGYIPLTTKAGFTNGVALQNTGTVPLNLRFRLVNSDGSINQISAPPEVNPLPVNGQYARLVGPEMGFTNAVNPNSSLEISVQGGGTFAALPLVIGNGYISSSAMATTDIDATLFFPQVVDGVGYSTAIRLVNPYTATATGTLSFFNQDGTNRSVTIAGLGTASQFSVTLPVRASAVLETTGTAAAVGVGMARFDSSIPVGGAATIFYGPTHVGVPPSTPMRSGRIAVNTVGSNNTGVAIGNGGSAPAPLTVSFQNRDGAGAQTLQPAIVNPLPTSGQTARYVTELGFSGATNVADSSLVIAAPADGVFAPLALLQQGNVFSSTATARQRLFNPQDFAGNYSGTWSTPGFGIGGNMTLNVVVDAAGNATISLTLVASSDITPPPPLSVTGTFDADGNLRTSGNLYLKVQPDGTLTVYILPNPGVIITPTGVIASYAMTGYLSGKSIKGDLLIFQTDGTKATGTFVLTKP
jgi:hypothetical protein